MDVILENYNNLVFVGKNALLIEFLVHLFIDLLCKIYANSLNCLELTRNKGNSDSGHDFFMVLLLHFLCSLQE